MQLFLGRFYNDAGILNADTVVSTIILAFKTAETVVFIMILVVVMILAFLRAHTVVFRMLPVVFAQIHDFSCAYTVCSYNDSGLLERIYLFAYHESNVVFK